MPEPDIHKTPEVLNHIDRAKLGLISYVEKKVPDVDKALLGKAVEFSILAHTNQYRHSGKAYIEHPFEVAKLLADFNMDGATIAAGLLHDVVEDTHTEIGEISAQFGQDIAFLVDAVTKISAIQVKSRIERQAETFRKMLLSMAKDFRVIVIKFADRLHNMRTLEYMNDGKKRAIAAETLEVYAPLAHRFGMAKIRWELEDLAFKTLNSDAYKNLVYKVVGKRKEREAEIRELINSVREKIDGAGISAKIYGRPKHFYSIYNKMRSRQVGFKDVYDLFALRIIVKSVGECYHALGVIHNLWPPLQARFKDFIATPKSNLYQSLHTTLVGPTGKPVEIQIRTEEMEMTAEHGIAAHWAYKEERASRKVEKENSWLKQFVEWQDDFKDSAEFMEFIKVDIRTEQVFVFTPTGDMQQLPKGSTALDFAFAVHSEVGIHCIGAKVDGAMVSLDKVLRTGSTVEILKSSDQNPSRDWLRIVVTPKAKNNIRRWLKNEEKEKSIQLGRELAVREYRDQHTAEEVRANFQLFADKYGVRDWDELYERLGNGEITLGSLSGFLNKFKSEEPKSMLERVGIIKPKERKNAVLVSGITGMLVRFASCCQPVPGDSIIGYVTKGRGISIHRAKCAEGLRLTQDKERVVPVQWNEDSRESYDVSIEIQAKDKPGLLNEMTKIMSLCDINVERASIVTIKGHVRNRFKINVKSLEQLDTAFEKIKRIKEVRTIFRRASGGLSGEG